MAILPMKQRRVAE